MINLGDTILKTLTLLLVLVFIGCNTYVWQPVNKLVLGTWVVSPDPDEFGNTEKWKFEDGCLTISLYQGDVLIQELQFKDPDNPADFSTCIEYEIVSMVHKDYIETPRWFAGNVAELNVNIGRWLVIKINKDELYLSSEIKNVYGKVIKGDHQKGFVKEK